MTPDQEKELQKAAEEYYAKEHDREDGELVKPYTLKSFLAGAKHQDAISRRDERRLIEEQLLWEIVNSNLSEDCFGFIQDYFDSRRIETGESK